jgi:WD40 repeat protein
MVMSVAFSPDGSTIVSGSNDKTIKVWDAGSLTHHIYHPTQN